MNNENRDVLLRRIFVTGWALVTLVLVLCVMLLAWEIGQRGGSPSPVAGGNEAPAAPAEPTLPGRTAVEVPLFFADGDGQYLVPETRRLELSDSTLDNCRRAVAALIEGPRDVLTPIMANTAKIRGMYLLNNGELVVDFSRELELGHRKSAAAEALFAYGVAATVTQRALQAGNGPVVRTVRFLLEGSPPGEAFPSHMDWSEPLAANPAWAGEAPKARGNV